MMPTVDELLDHGEAAIRNSKQVDLWRVSDARVNAEELLGEVIGVEITSENLNDKVSAVHAAKYRRLVVRRAAGEPVALILGFTEFAGMKLIVKKGVFVPRNSSELLAEKAASRLRRRKAPVAVDVATGTGPVALLIAKKVKHADVYGLDIWKPSIEVAKENSKHLGLKVQFLESDMLQKLPARLKGSVDVFTGHLPYVARRDVKGLASEIRDFEPTVSLTDNSVDGMGLINKLVTEAPRWLSKGGWILIEVSPDLSRRVSAIMRRGGFTSVKSEKDSLGATRVVSGRLP